MRSPPHPTRVLISLVMALSCSAPLSAQQPLLRDRAITPWLLLGVFPSDSGAARVTREYVPAEAGLHPREGDTLGGRTWRLARADSLGRFDINAHFPTLPRAMAVAYALTYITSPSDRTVLLAIESDDDVMVWLNGALIHHHEIARGLGSSTDTVAIRLARGVNRLLYKVVNRTGGFGMGARFLALSPDPIGDLLVTSEQPSLERFARQPAPAVTLGPARLAARAALDAASAQLTVPVEVRATRWGGLRAPVFIHAGSRSAALPETNGSLPASVSVPVAWSELARLARTRQPQVTARAAGLAALSHPLTISAEALLTLLSRPIQIHGWRQTDDATKPTASWPVLHDSTRSSATAIAFWTRVPEVLGGLTLFLHAAEFGAAARYQLNGSDVRPDALGDVTLCSPCGAGETLDFRIVLEPAREWWDPPLLRIRDAGWAEIREGARWARVFTGDSTLAVPDSAVASYLLTAAVDPRKEGYRREVDRWLQRLAPAAARIRADTFRLAGNSHIDAAWLWRWTETVDVVRNTWRTATKLLAKYPDIHFAASSAQYYVWLEQHEPSLLKTIQDAVRDGRWTPVGGWWVEADANIPSGESLARQALIGQSTFTRLFGGPSRIAWIPDTFGYAWTLPQIFLRSGFRSFITQKVRWTDWNRWPATQNIFWWEGPDGSRILTYVPYGYDHDLNPERLAREWHASADSSAAREMLVLYGVGDHGGGPTMEMLDRRRDLQRVPTFPALRDEPPDSSLERMRREIEPDAPVIRDELYLEYHRGVFTTQARAKLRNRQLEGLLLAAEAAAAAAPLPYPRDDLRRAWERVLFNQFHDILPGTSIAPVYVDAEADYRAADSIASRVLAQSVASIAERLDTRPPRSGQRTYAVFNPSGRQRTGIVSLSVGSTDAGLRAFDGNGRALPATSSGDSLRVLVRDVPATGVKLVFVGGATGSSPTNRERSNAGVVSPQRPVDPSDGGAAPTAAGGNNTVVLENAFLRAEIDPTTGDIARLYDKRARRDALSSNGAGNSLLLIEDRPRNWDAWNIDHLDGTRTAVDRNVIVERVVPDAIARSVVVRRSAVGIAAVQRYVLPHHAARLDVETTIDWRADRQLLKAVFPLAIRPDSVWAEIPFGAIPRPTVPQNRRDSARFELPMQRWIDGSAGAFGVAIVNDGKYGFDVKADTLRLTLLRSPKSPDPETDMGMHRIRYSIVPHAGDWRAQEIRDAADALNIPLRAVEVPRHPGRGRIHRFVELVGDGVELTALKKAEAEEAYVVRLVETRGTAATATLRWPFAVIAHAADLLEQPTTPPEMLEGTALRVPLRPWQIRTFVVRPK